MYVWGTKGFKEKFKAAWSKECAFKVRVNTCQKSTSQCNKIIMIITNKKTIDISNETLIETFRIFQRTSSRFDYFFI